MSKERNRVAMLSDLTRLAERLEKRLSEESTTTRRHFDLVAERVEDSVRLVAEVTAHDSTILDNHESRLQKVEKRT